MPNTHLHQLHPETQPINLCQQTVDFLGKERVTRHAIFIAKLLPISACTERILAILQQWITVLVEGYSQQHSSW